MRTLDLGTQYRVGDFDRASMDEAKRTVNLSFSSELPVERYFGNEILDHSPASVKMDRMRGGAPLLVEHNRADQVGVIESASIGQDKRGHAVVRFGSSARAQEIFQDVKDGIRGLVSVGYRVHKMVADKIENGVETLRATSWEPMEISIVSIPADPSVGVGRAESTDKQTVTIESNQNMKRIYDKEPLEGGGSNKQDINIEVIESRAQTAIQERNREVGSIVDRLKDTYPEIRDIGQKAMCGEMTLAQFRDEAFKLKVNAKPIDVAKPAALVGMSAKEAKAYSFRKAILEGSQGKLSGLEKEAHDAGLKTLGREQNGPNSIIVPFDVLSQRDQLVGTGTIGGNLVATNLLAGSFIELLRNRIAVARMGATTLEGLVGNIAIPKQTAGAVVSWQASEAATHTEGSVTIGQVTMAPKQIAARVDYSWLLLQQSTPQIDSIIRNDLQAVLARGIDLAALHGTGASGQPLGLISQTGVGSVALGTNGGTITWGALVSLETAVATANADLGNLGYLSNAVQRGRGKTVEKASATGIYLWQDGTQPDFGMINGYKAFASNQVASNLTKGTATTICSAVFFGNWSELFIGMWGGLELLANPYSQAATRIIELHAWQAVDVACRHGESFSVISDAL